MDAPLSTPLMSASDPFYAVRDALDDHVQSTKLKFDKWKGMLHSTNTATDVAFRTLHEEVKRDVTKSDEMCTKVRLAVSNVERSRAKFPHIDDRELQSRKDFVERLEAMAKNMKLELNSRETQGKLEGDERRQLASRQNAEINNAARNQNAYTKSNNDYMKDQQQQQSLIRREQDATLDKIGTGLDTLKEMAVAIDAELKDQEKMIDDVDRDIDEVQGKMDAAMKNIEKLLNTKDRCQIFTILALVVIFVIVTAVAVT